MRWYFYFRDFHKDNVWFEQKRNQNLDSDLEVMEKKNLRFTMDTQTTARNFSFCFPFLYHSLISLFYIYISVCAIMPSLLEKIILLTTRTTVGTIACVLVGTLFVYFFLFGKRHILTCSLYSVLISF